MNEYKKAAGVSLLLTLIVWLVFSWPLPLHLFSALPAGSAKPPQSMAVQPMMPGDHLQLDYHFWLFSDMLAGHTPWFYNLYEFNTGDDRARYEPASYYVPFSLFYAIGSWLGSRAFGWNLASFLSLWFTALFTYGLVRRYAPAGPAWFAAAVAITLPYRWITLLGGSPTGFGMMWVPALLLGLDLAVREDKMAGGAIAGAALLFAAWGDAHTFFFSALVIPCWCLFAFMQRRDFPWRLWRSYARLALSLAPIAFFAVAALWSSKTTTMQMSAAKAARTIREVSLFSPTAEGLFSWRDLGITNHIFLGCVLVSFLALGLVYTAAVRTPDRMRRVANMLVLLLGIAGMILLALGPFSPFDGRFFSAARKFIPHYNMIRQPAKIYCLMPSVLAVLCGLMAARVRPTLLLLAGLLLVGEYRLQVQPIICRWDNSQGAYRAVADTAAAQGIVARALVLPLWPGDSHYSSIYQHYVSLYRIRMVNGYRPFVAPEYIDTIFHRFEDANLGYLPEDQIDELDKRGVHFILLHEDLFPEKVSPFPVGFTLKHLLNNPRLRFLKQDGPVWAFQIVPAHAPDNSVASDWNVEFPARRIELEKEHAVDARPGADKYACRGGYVKLHAPGAVVTTMPVRAVPADGLRWLVRMRGQGTIHCTTRAGEREEKQDINVQSPDWTWFEAPLPALTGYEDVSVSLQNAEGSIDADAAYLVAGAWPSLQPGETFRIPAACFFHAGRTRLETGSVVFSTRRDRLGTVLYGPKLPLAPGWYEMEIALSTAAPANTDLGTVIVTYADGPDIKQLPVRAGTPTRAVLNIERTLPFMIAYSFSGAADVEFSYVTIRRVK